MGASTMPRTKLSININKYALIRNSRGHNVPDLGSSMNQCLAAGADGITIHPRRDQRHIRFDDVQTVASHLTQHHPGIELNIECELNPFFIDMVLDCAPAQCTLVPVTPGEITSDHGWDISRYRHVLAPSLKRLKNAGIRTSVFMNCMPELMAAAADVGADRVELYTGPYAWAWNTEHQQRETDLVWASAEAAAACGLEVNAGHDLDRHNLVGIRDIPSLLEVSIGHAHVCRALEVGTKQSIQELLNSLS